MPVATFPGNRGWGYDGLYLSAVHPAYGGPDGLARLVDAAHRAGLAVILDVVYNHLGPGSEAITAFGPYVTDRHETPWGGALDFSQPAVREWAIQNAELWANDFRIDGLRLDAVFAILDDESPKHVLAELRERLPDTLLVAEEEVGTYRPIEEWGFDAQWADDFHHELHVALTGESHGYYGQYGSLADMARLYERRPPEKFVYCSQNHDQVGNRAARRPPGDGRARAPRRRAPLRAADAAPVHGRGVRRAAAVPVLHRPRRPADRRGDARGPPPRVRLRRQTTSPIRRPSRPSSTPSSRARSSPACASSTPTCSASAAGSRATHPPSETTRRVS